MQVKKLYQRIINSTRRFCACPSTVFSFVIGREPPKPCEVKRVSEMPFFIK